MESQPTDVVLHPPELLEQVGSLPDLPGVYRFFDAEDQLLYVGKAVSLRSRVASYFRLRTGGTRIAYMVSKIRRLETTVVRSEAEALLLENNLIKALRPKFNILFRDDKSYPSLVLMYAGSEQPSGPRSGAATQFPRLAYYRGRPVREHLLFGPYPNAAAVKESIRLLQKVFRLRTCEDAVFQNRTRPCLLYEIKRCSGPCVGCIDPQTYGRDVASAAAFLRGETEQVFGELRARMQAHSDALEFERAAEVRDQIAALSTILHQQAVETGGEKDADIVAVRVGGGRACVNLAMVRGGRHLGDRAFFPKNIEEAMAISEGWQPSAAVGDVNEAHEGASAPASLEQRVLHAFLAQHYLGAALPPLLIVSQAVEPELQQLLVQEGVGRLKITDSPRGVHRVWLEMAEKNAEIQLARVLSEQGSQRARTEALAEVLGLDVEDLDEVVIECFDISHSSGEATHASCVVYDHHQMQPSKYRRFRIEGITPGDDYAAMRQALRRRYGPLAAVEPSEAAVSTGEEASARGGDARGRRLPSVVLVDGGVGQVHAAAEVFRSLGLSERLIVGVEKGEGRKVGLEELVFADGREKRSLRPDSAALMLVAQIRDEAHRFAITGMRAQRAKTRFGGGALEEIPGIGPKRRARLLQQFGGVRGVSEASVEDLMRVEGISRSLAETIHRAFH